MHTHGTSFGYNQCAIYIESKVPFNPISLSLNVLLMLLCYIYWIYIQFVWELKTHRLLPMIVGIDGDEMCRQERECKSVVENPYSRGGRIILKYCILLTSFSLTLYLFLIQTTSDHSRKNSMYTLCCCCSCQNGFAFEFISIWKTLIVFLNALFFH